MCAAPLYSMAYSWLTLDPARLMRDSRLQSFEVAGDYDADSAEYLADVADLIDDGAKRVSVHLRNSLGEIGSNLNWPFSDLQMVNGLPTLTADERDERRDEMASLANAATKDFALAALRRNLSGDENARSAITLEQSANALLDELTISIGKVARAITDAVAVASGAARGRIGAINMGYE